MRLSAREAWGLLYNLRGSYHSHIFPSLAFLCHVLLSPLTTVERPASMCGTVKHRKALLGSRLESAFTSRGGFPLQGTLQRTKVRVRVRVREVHQFHPHSRRQRGQEESRNALQRRDNECVTVPRMART